MNAMTPPSAFRPATPVTARRSLGRRLADAWVVVERIAEVRRQRKALAALDDRMLADLALSRADVERESTRGLLDLPATRASGADAALRSVLARR